MKKAINGREAAELIKTSGGRIFSVEFVKRSNGDIRNMTARRGVLAGVTGDGMRYDTDAHDLLTVAEMVSTRDDRGRFNGGRHQFRSIPIEGIQSLKIGGEKFEVSA